ncbi:hypothetical protein C7N43_31705 [Sphingobacteriales bacterium UPWRP_1]|nr:hypothetical protein BVG80_01530 [Sphingobacteriales bacterium TSM_CSM]PSJ72932.1 hypothetical protein C7N43_31705 [Sphingobacteriales bacterium UPWRP_1]
MNYRLLVFLVNFFLKKATGVPNAAVFSPWFCNFLAIFKIFYLLIWLQFKISRANVFSLF